MEPHTPSPTQENNERAMARLPSYYRPLPSFTEIGDVMTIPQGSVGTQDRPPGKWAELVWDTSWKATATGQQLKRKLPLELLKRPPVRELMARPGFFFSGKREEERISDKRANIESAVIQCMGEVQDPPCTSCMRLPRPLGMSKCVALADGTGDARACAGCRWNGQYKRCSIWKAAQEQSTSGDVGADASKSRYSEKDYRNWTSVLETVEFMAEAAQMVRSAAGNHPVQSEKVMLNRLAAQIELLLRVGKPARDSLSRVMA
ncbi:hypothetical protein N7470_005673 [Penicillium chermesinum]|nr:hypothetical protein N7470_005673 [Penicillium chermesinum]